MALQPHTHLCRHLQDAIGARLPGYNGHLLCYLLNIRGAGVGLNAVCVLYSTLCCLVYLLRPVLKDEGKGGGGFSAKVLVTLPLVQARALLQGMPTPVNRYAIQLEQSLPSESDPDMLLTCSSKTVYLYSTLLPAGSSTCAIQARKCCDTARGISLSAALPPTKRAVYLQNCVSMRA